jgi:hypothetical protein
MPAEIFKTNDMGMATYLEMQGHTAQTIAFEGQNCYWHFLLGEALERDVDDFLTQRASVTPQAYNKQYALVKREMIDARARKDQGRRNRAQ